MSMYLSWRPSMIWIVLPLRAAKSRLAVPAHDFIPIARADRA
jgi:hypothetical protein